MGGATQCVRGWGEGAPSLGAGGTVLGSHSGRPHPPHPPASTASIWRLVLPSEGVCLCALPRGPQVSSRSPAHPHPPSTEPRTSPSWAVPLPVAAGIAAGVLALGVLLGLLCWRRVNGQR